MIPATHTRCPAHSGDTGRLGHATGDQREDVSTKLLLASVLSVSHTQRFDDQVARFDCVPIDSHTVDPQQVTLHQPGHTATD